MLPLHLELLAYFAGCINEFIDFSVIFFYFCPHVNIISLLRTFEADVGFSCF